jgi:beta-lactamase regulating signal transducer with metallopeptidase domain
MSVSWVATLNQWGDQWAAGIWRACWQGSVVILLVWGVCLALPQMSPRVRCWFWRLAYIKLFIALLWTTPVDIPLLRPARTPELISAPMHSPALPPMTHLPGLHRSGTGGPASAVVTKNSLTPLSLLALLWLLGGMVVGAQTVQDWRSVRLRRGVAPLHSTVHAALAADFARLCQRCGIRRPIALLVTTASNRPYVFGVVRPAIVLPADLLEGPDHNGLPAVLAHEVAHVQRKDLLWNWLPTLAHALFFFCPFVWLANREWQLAQEIACDEMAVLNTRAEVADYGEMLVRMVAPNWRASRPSISMLGIVETPQTLKRRLIAMKFIRPISRRKLVLAGVACVALVLFGIVPWQVVAQGARANRILFVSNRMDTHRFRIFAMDPDGSHVVRLTHDPLPESEVISAANGKNTLRPVATHRNAMELDPVWSPDGKQIAFTLAVSEKLEPDASVKMNLYVMNADGSGCKEVTHYAYGLQATSPAWSPDGKYLAFTLQSRENDAPGGMSSAVCVTDFTGFWPVAPGMWPSWTADSKEVRYSAFADRTGTTTDLYEANMAGAGFGRKKLLEGVRQGVFSPDGTRLAYLSIKSEPNGDKIGNIVVSNADGSQPKQVTQLHDTGPVGFQWSADGRQIYFTRPTSPDATQVVNYQIYAMDADGSHLQALTKGDAPDYLGGSSDLVLANNGMNRIATKK